MAGPWLCVGLASFGAVSETVPVHERRAIRRFSEAPKKKPVYPAAPVWTMRSSLILWLLGSLLVFACWRPDVAAAYENLDELVKLDYQVESGLSECPDVDAFKTFVEQRSGPNVAVPEVPPDVEVRVRREGEGLTGSILWRESGETPQAPRTLRTPNDDCARLVATLAFVMAVQIEVMGSEARARATATTTAPIEVREPPGPSDQNKSSDDSAEAVPPAFTLALGLGPAVGVGLAPSVTVQGRVFASLHRHPLSVELGFEGRPSATTLVADGAGFRHRSMLGTFAACWSTGDFSTCGLTKVGAFQVTGEGVDRSASPVGLVVQVGPRIGYLYRFGNRLGVYGHTDAGYLLSPWTVHLDGATVWTMPRLSAAAGIDFVVRFP